MLPFTPPSPSMHRIKRKPAPSIGADLESRYPPPDPSDPLASLASLRARTRSNQPTEKETHVLGCDVQIASPETTLSAWYEVYPGSPLGFGYLPSHPYRVSSIHKSNVTRKGSLGHEKRTSHYRPRSISLAQQSETQPVEELPTSRSLPPLTFDSDDTASSESRSSDGASLHTSASADHCFSSRSSVMSNFGSEAVPPAKTLVETAKVHKRLSKRSSLASSTLSYSTAPASLSSESDKNDASPAASFRSHPFAHSSNSLRTTPTCQPPRRIGGVSLVPPQYYGEALPSTRTYSTGSFSSYVHVLTPSIPSYETRPLSPVDERPHAIGVPTVHDLSYAATCHVVAENGVRVSLSDLCASSSTTIVCFIRHFWCPLSQNYVASLGKEIDVESLQRAGARLVIIGNGSPQMIKSYKRMFHTPFDLYCDPSQKLYEALGLGRIPRDHRHHSHGLVRLFLRAVRSGMPVWGKGGDPEQLGGEFVFQGSALNCSFAHRMAQIGDHTPISQVFNASHLFSALRNPPQSICGQGQRPLLRKSHSSFLQMTGDDQGQTGRIHEL